MIILVLGEATPSRNAVDKLHWTARNRLRERWQWLIRVARLNERIVPVRWPHALLTIERYGPRKLDHDNLVGGAKQLIDALKHEGFIVDDTPEHVTVEYRQKTGTPATRIQITPRS